MAVFLFTFTDDMVLVTGGTGLVGSHLLFELVTNGKSVRALKRSSSNLALTRHIFSYYHDDYASLFEKIEWVTGDLMDIGSLHEALDGIVEVYHCAAFVSFNPRDHQRMLDINIRGTANLVNAALKHKVLKFGHVSSIAALGRTEKAEHINEKTTWQYSRNNSVYAISKYESEQEVWRGMAEGLNAVIVNPSVIIGPGNWQVASGRLFTQVWKGLKFYSMGVNGFVDVRDVVRPLIQLMEKDRFNARYILNGENRCYRDIFNYLAHYLHKRPPYIRASRALGSLAWRYEKIRTTLFGGHAFITKETARTANNVSYYDNDLIRQELGYEFLSIENSIASCCHLFLQDIQPSTSSAAKISERVRASHVRP